MPLIIALEGGFLMNNTSGLLGDHRVHPYILEQLFYDSFEMLKLCGNLWFMQFSTMICPSWPVKKKTMKKYHKRIIAKLMRQITHLSSRKVFKDFLSNSTRSNPSNGFPSRRSTTALNMRVQM